MTSSSLGTLQELGDDRYQLTFTRTLAHPRPKVWAAITENAHLAHWFPGVIRGERVAGARLEFVESGGEDGETSFEGEMLVFEPPSLIELLWGTDTIRIELVEEGADGTTVLTLTDTFTELGKAARDGAGWHDCLDQLAHHLDGTTAPLGSATRWKSLDARYVAALGPAAATIGVPDDYEFED